MFTNFWLNALVSFIIALLIAWVVLSVVIIWARPVFYNNDGSVNWLTTLWVAALIIVFTWILLMIIYWLVEYCMSSCEEPCAEKSEIIHEKPCHEKHEKPCHGDMPMMGRGLYKF